MYSFEKLEVWQKTRKFVNEIYKITSTFPKEEQFGLTQHIRRSAISILSNIAEATSRFGKIDFKRFLEIAIGSLYETVSQLFEAVAEGKSVTYDDSGIIAKMLSGLSKSKTINHKQYTINRS
ncbi:MAG: four helix bundle protein [Endomicrobiia bacterium]